MRNKQKDLQTVEEFITVLSLFKQKKMEKWEKVDDEFQAKNRLASPSEDWVIPPDESEVEKLLFYDSEYRELREALIELKDEIRCIAAFLETDLHHSLDWLKFSTPLLGNVVIDDCLQFGEHLKLQCQRSGYVKKNLKALFFG